jgi:hypothetical protein
MLSGTMVVLATGCSHATPISRPNGIAATDPSLAALKHYFDTHPNRSTMFGSAREGVRLTGLDSQGLSMLSQWLVPDDPMDTRASEYIIRWDQLQGAEMYVHSDSVFLLVKLQPFGTVRTFGPNPWDTTSNPHWKEAPSPIIRFNFDSRSDADTFFKLFESAAKRHGALANSLRLTVHTD